MNWRVYNSAMVAHRVRLIFCEHADSGNTDLPTHRLTYSKQYTPPSSKGNLTFTVASVLENAIFNHKITTFLHIITLPLES